MQTSEIIELIKALDSTDLRLLEFETEEMKITLSKDAKSEVIAQAAPILQAQTVPMSVKSPELSNIVNEVAVKSEVKTEVVNQVSVNDPNCVLVKSPIVGTFYASPSPDTPAFVKKGDQVKKGDVLCIVEAMKLMNEIDSELDGEIVEVLVANESVVEYGQPLFKICKK